MVRSVAGNVLAQVAPAPETAGALREMLEAECGVQADCQKLLLGPRVLQDDEAIGPDASELMLVVDETPLFHWDFLSNPDATLLSGSGPDVLFATGAYDYVNVITQSPVRRGEHYFEFVMHVVGDEQWCGVALSTERAGHRGGRARGWFYYSGRRYHSQGALHAERERHSVMDFEHVVNGDVIGMLLDTEQRRLVFFLNGRLQGGCEVPAQPLYLSTSLDEEGDHVELRKLPLEQAPVTSQQLEDLQLHPLTEDTGEGRLIKDRTFVPQEDAGEDSDSEDDSADDSEDSENGSEDGREHDSEDGCEGDTPTEQAPVTPAQAPQVFDSPWKEEAGEDKPPSSKKDTGEDREWASLTVPASLAGQVLEASEMRPMIGEIQKGGRARRRWWCCARARPRE
jgi:hypothetical protein